MEGCIRNIPDYSLTYIMKKEGELGDPQGVERAAEGRSPDAYALTCKKWRPKTNT